MSRTFAICDTPEAVAHARRTWPCAQIVTDNPLLAEARPDLAPILNIDARLSQAEALALGTAALELTRDVDAAVASSPLPDRYGLIRSHIYLTGALSRLFASLMHRGGALARALSYFAIDDVCIATHATPRWEPRNPFMLPRFAHPARALAEHGFFGARIWNYTAVATQLPASINETAARSKMRRALVMPASVIRHEMLRRLRGGPPSSRIVKIGELNEALRETVAQLAATGTTCSPARGMRAVGPPSDGSFEITAPIDPETAAVVRDLTCEHFARTGLFNAEQANAAADLVCQHMTAGLAWLSRQTSAMRQVIVEDFPDGGILLTNGLFGPSGAQAYGLYASQGVKVVEFEHGVTAGIAALTNTKLNHRSPPVPDLHLVCSPRAVAAFTGNTGQDSDTVVAIGLPDAVRRLQAAPAQRWLARRALRLKHDEFVMIHVSTLPYQGNQRPGLGAPTETKIFTIDKTLLTDVYAHCPHRVVFKQYPTQRFPYEPGYNEVFELPLNVSVTKDEDFRYIRAAADAIVTMTPTSTLGWCVGAGVPIVWLASRQINPLADERTDAEFAAAFPSVDLDRPDWAARLTELVSDLSALRREWQSRERARDALYRDAIIGPAGTTGRRAAAAVQALIATRKPTIGAARTATGRGASSGDVHGQ